MNGHGSRAYSSWESTFLHPCSDSRVHKCLTNNYCGATSVGEDSSGALSNASLFFHFERKQN